jgi:outer membrane protein
MMRQRAPLVPAAPALARALHALPARPWTSPSSVTKRFPTTRSCKARAANSEELPLARVKLLPQVSASLTASRDSTDFGGGFPSFSGSSNGYVIRSRSR